MFGNNHRIRLGKETMTRSVTKEREEANPHIPKRGRRRNPGGVEKSHAAQSQVVDPTPVPVYDTQDEGYDSTEQHYIDGPEGSYFQPPEVEDDEAESEVEGEAQEVGHAIPEGPPFPRKPENLPILCKYASHVAVPLWHNTDNISVCIRFYFYFI